MPKKLKAPKVKRDRRITVSLPGYIKDKMEAESTATDKSESLIVLESLKKRYNY